MDTNNSLFNKSTSTRDDFNEATVPLYLTYLRLLILLIVTPSVMAIEIIIKNAALRTVNNIFPVNILIADVCIVLY